MDRPLKEYYIKLQIKSAVRKSKVWDYFGNLVLSKNDKLIEEDKVFCSLCLKQQQEENDSVSFSCAKVQVYSKNCSTGNLSRHLKNDHNLRDIDPATSGGSITTFFNKRIQRTPTDRKWNLARDLALWMARDLLPFHIVSHNGIKDFFKKYHIIVADEDLPHFKTISTTALDDVYESVLKSVVGKISGQKDFALTFDLWSDNFRRRNYITFTFHFLSSNYEMKHLTLITKHVSKTHSANNILAELEEVTETFHLQLGSNFVVTDQGSNMKKAIVLAGLNNHFCLGHGLHNLLNVDGYNSVPVITNLIVKCKAIVRTLRFKTHSLRCQADQLQKEILANVDNLEELLASEDDAWVDYDDGFGPLDNVPLETYKNINDLNDLAGSLVNKRNITLKNSVPTRWHSILTMIDSLGCQRTAVNKLLSASNRSDLILLEFEAQLLYKLKDFLQKFKDAVNILSGDSYPSLSLALLIRTEIISILNDVDTNEFIYEMANNIKQKLNHRFPITDILICASLLDPRSNSLDCIMQYCEQQNLTKIDFLVKMYKNLIGDIQETADQDDDSDQGATSSKIIKLVQRHSTLSKNSSLETECHLLLSLSSDKDVLSFWREKGSAMPLLAKLAHKVLCIPATSTPSERVFSIAGLTITNKRSQLSPHNVNKIIFIHDNFETCQSW